ncbi:hypothetical protein ES708_33323 [subsurface metagenome]
MSFIPGNWNELLPEWHELEFDTPVTINEEVRMGVEYDDGDASNFLRIRYTGDVKEDELLSYYIAGYTDWSPGDLAYIYTYTLP